MAPRPLSTNRWDAVDDICEFRKYELVKAVPNVRPAGRLLVYFPDEDLTDGSAEVASQGFFDVYNAPPWGTWVGYFEDVARTRGARVICLPGCRMLWLRWQAGIDVNPEQCIAWLTDVQVGLRSIIDEVELR